MQEIKKNTEMGDLQWHNMRTKWW